MTSMQGPKLKAQIELNTKVNKIYDEVNVNKEMNLSNTRYGTVIM